MGFYKWFRKAMSVFRVLSATASGTVQVGGTSRNLVIDVSDNTNAALRVTQRGTGNALLVEDSTNPDSTPFVINTDGRIIQNHTALTAVGAISTQHFQIHGTAMVGIPSFNMSGWNASNLAGIFSVAKSRGTTAGDFTIVQNGDQLGNFQFYGSDGTQHVMAALIQAAVDGTPGLNDMPGRIVFSTTADGASTPTERVRIDSAGLMTITGRQIINANSASDAVRITQTGAGNALVVEDSTNPDSTPFVVDMSGRLVIGATAALDAQQLLGIQSQANFSGVFANSYGDTNDRAFFHFVSRARNTPAAPTILQSGDTIETYVFRGHDGVTFVNAARIDVSVDGVPGVNDMPGRITFSTSADGSATPTERMRIDSAGRIGIGVVPGGGYQLRIAGNAATDNGIGITSNSSIRSTVVSNYSAFSTFDINTEAAVFTLANLRHYDVAQGTIGAGSAITNQFGFHCGSSPVGATNNYGFYGNIPSGTGRWNFYGNGTARNFFAGGVEVLAGTTTQAAGFLNCSAAAGAPTGVPTNPTGNVPLYYDTTNQRLYVYNGAWRSVLLA